MNPEKKDFPYQIELFSRKPGLVLLNEPAHLTPIPTDEELSSLSAILLNDDYYNFIINHSSLIDDAHLANTEALICLKSKAYLDMIERKANGEIIDEKHIRKHKADIFRLGVFLSETNVFELPENLKTDVQAFVDSIANDLPDKVIFKEMGLGIINLKKVYEQILKSFKLDKATINEQ